jgi:hypothetical protein
LDGDLSRLPAGLRDVVIYAKKIANREDDAELRDRLTKELGEEAFIELGLAIASSRIFPALKRALGYAVTCSRVTVTV